MLRIRLVTAVIGYLSQGFVVLMTIPLIVSLLTQQLNSTMAFLFTIAISCVLGRIAMRAEKAVDFDDLTRIESMAVVVFGWLTLAVLGTIPYLYFGMSFIDALFESMSGFTTTGSTILSDFSILNSSMFFYRGFTQWIGGLGILVIFVALLPQLAIAGRHLFFAEVSAESKDKLTPRIKDTASQLLGWYVFITLLCIAGLCFSGMPLIESASNAFATIAAAGFCPKDGSIYTYHNSMAEWVLIACMFLAGANFVLQVKSVKTLMTCLEPKKKFHRKNVLSIIKESIYTFFSNSELVAYIIIIAFATIGISCSLYCSLPEGNTIIDIIRQALFQCLSILTTTGAASVDYEYWPMVAKAFLIILMFIGGCSGSAGGGMKVIRILILWRYFWKMLLKNIFPEAVIRIKLGDRILRDVDVQPILTFFMFYILVFFIGGTAICMLENSMVVGYTGSIALLGNIGPGFEVIGPMGNFANWHFISKLIAVFLMWAGRLEVMALVVFFRPEIWRDSRW